MNTLTNNTKKTVFTTYLKGTATAVVVSVVFLSLQSCASSHPVGMVESQKTYLKNKKPEQWASLKKQKKLQDQKRKQLDWAWD